MAAELLKESISKIFIGEAQREVEQNPTEPITPPKANGNFVVDESIVACMFLKFLSYVTIDAHHSLTIAFPVPGTRIVHALNYGESLWGKTAKVNVQLPSGKRENYFLKVEST